MKQKYPLTNITFYKERFYFVISSELCNSWINDDRFIYLFIYFSAFAVDMRPPWDLSNFTLFLLLDRKTY